MGFAYSKRAGGPAQYAHLAEIAEVALGQDPSDIDRIYQSLLWAGASVTWNAMTWLADMPASGGTILVEVRTGTTGTPDTTNWTAFHAIATSGGSIGSSGQYAQYRLTPSTTVANAAPAVKEVVLTFVK